MSCSTYTNGSSDCSTRRYSEPPPMREVVECVLPPKPKLKMSRKLSSMEYGGDSVVGKIENWDIHGTRIVGNIVHDRRGRFSDGEFMYTSTVPDCDLYNLKEGDTIQTRNSQYLLGKKGCPQDI